MTSSVSTKTIDAGLLETPLPTEDSHDILIKFHNGSLVTNLTSQELNSLTWNKLSHTHYQLLAEAILSSQLRLNSSVKAFTHKERVNLFIEEVLIDLPLESIRIPASELRIWLENH